MTITRRFPIPPDNPAPFMEIERKDKTYRVNVMNKTSKKVNLMAQIQASYFIIWSEKSLEATLGGHFYPRLVSLSNDR